MAFLQVDLKLLILVMLLSALRQVCSLDNDTRIPLYFSYITTKTGDYVGAGAIPAVDLALEQINNSSSILPNYTLEYTDILDSNCFQTVSLDSFFTHFLNSSQETYLSTLCCGCSTATIPVAEVSHYWNIPQMAFATAAFVVNDRDRFRTFFRTTPSFEFLSPSLAVLMQRFNWTQMAVVTQDEDLFTGPSDVLLPLFEQKGWKVDHTLIKSNAVPFPYDAIFDWAENEDFRIIFLNSYSDYGIRVMCEAYYRNYFGPKYVYITPSFYNEGWWGSSGNTSCPEAVLKAVLNGSLTVIAAGYLINEDDETTRAMSGMTSKDFKAEYERRLKWDKYSHLQEVTVAGMAYDATWAMAVGMDKAAERIRDKNESGCESLEGKIVPLENFTYSNKKLACILLKSYAQAMFEGVTGPISFDVNGSRYDNVIDYHQYRVQADGSVDKAHVMSVGIYGESQSTFEYGEGESAETLWPPSGVLYDGAAVDEIHPNSIILQVIFSIFSSLGLVYAFACLVFNIAFSGKKVVKLSSPKLNYLIVLGAALMYMTVLFYIYGSTSLDGASIQTALCNVRIWLFSISYTLLFAVILSKTWRVYYIFNNTSANKMMLVKDWMLFAIVGVVVSVDFLILMVGTAVPQSRLTATLTADVEHPSSVNDEGINISHFVFVCVTNESIIWLAISFAYKGLLQIVAMFMAFHTRNVKIQSLNEAIEIAGLVYINTIILVVVVVAGFAFNDYHETHASLYGLAMIVDATLFLTLTFVPKMFSLYRDPKGEHVIPTSLATTSDVKRTLKRSKPSGDRSDMEATINMYKNRILELEDEVGRLRSDTDAKEATL